jgi:hypothetical protein
MGEHDTKTLLGIGKLLVTHFIDVVHKMSWYTRNVTPMGQKPLSVV